MIQRTDSGLPAALVDLTRRHMTGEVSSRRHAASRARALDRLYASRRSPVLAWVAIAGAVTVGGGGVFAAAKNHFARLQEVGVMTVPENPEELSPTMEISVAPESAKIFWDDKPLEGNPAKMMDVSDKTPHRLRVEAPGFISQTHVVLMDGRNESLSFELKPTPFDIGKLSASAQLADADSIVEELRDDFRACYEEGLANDPEMVGKATITLKLSESGVVLASDITAKEGLSARVTTCLSHVASGARFRGTTRPETLSIPLAFRQK